MDLLYPWRRGIVGIASANQTEDTGFEYRQGVGKVFRNFYIAVLLSYFTYDPLALCVLEKNK
jgi:hypothetical protein